MADFRLIIFAVIMSVFSIASNAILINKERTKDALNKNEYNFAIGSLAGSILVLIAAIYSGFKGRDTMRGAAANRLMTASNYVRG
jgi:hypothetical protein